ncbi:MAG: hypothetical protein ISS36_01115 [Candidatus Aenigmarchaeota archaeon]|nr:hypothetical protein [Candidatus Aenigmarchaeota archaeon]
MAGIEEHAKSLNIKAALSTLIISAFGFAAALFWKDAIKDLINTVLPEGEGLAYSFTAAILVSVLAVVMIFVLSKTDAFSVRETVKVKVLRKRTDVKVEENVPGKTQKKTRAKKKTPKK